jgi:hypothetical protein
MPGESMPVRKIPKNYLVITGLFASAKNNTLCGYEGSLEPDLMHLAEFNRDIAKYEEQPVRIEYTDESNKKRAYTPDLLVFYTDEIVRATGAKPILIEVKPRAYLYERKSELKPKFIAAAAYGCKRDLKFRIVTETRIRTPYLKNVKFLLPFRRLPVNQNYTELLLNLVSWLGEADPETILLAASSDREERARILPFLWHLVANQVIATDLTKPLTMTTLLRLLPPGEKGANQCPVFSI